MLDASGSLTLQLGEVDGNIAERAGKAGLQQLTADGEVRGRHVPGSLTDLGEQCQPARRRLRGLQWHLGRPLVGLGQRLALRSRFPSIDDGAIGVDVVLAQLEQACRELIEFRHEAGEDLPVLLLLCLLRAELRHHAHERRAHRGPQRSGAPTSWDGARRRQSLEVVADRLVSDGGHSADHTRFSRIWSMRNAGSTMASLMTPTAASSGIVPTISEASTSTPRRFASSRITLKTFQMFVTR